ncbi:MAG: carboxypeptidase regulatory-like domain-containing protein [Candidatus Cloacimonetes bacterium]|nr:carboxypeptidase regulatory-like domain-containing protein [Candidatus Cloacimonadota bacterium]
MKKIVFTLLVFTLLFSVPLLAEKVIIRIDNPGRAIATYFLENDYDIASYFPEKYIDIFIHEERLPEISKLGYHFRIVDSETKMKENIVTRAKDIYGYRTYDDMKTELLQLAFNNPGLINLTTIGESRGKYYSTWGNTNYDDYQHDIWCLKLSDNVTSNEDEPNIIFDGGHHAREPIGMELTMLILNYLVDNYGIDPDVTFWIDNAQIWFVPLVNPDGHKIVISQDDTSWRKNIRDNDLNGQITWGGYQYPDGVDCNRNYGPLDWFGGAGTSGPTGETYCGPEPFSEPETSALRNLLAQYRFDLGMSYHSYSELIMWPLGYNMTCQAPDQSALANLGQEMAVTVPSQYGGHYTPQQTNALYPCSGTTTDYGYGVERIFYFITELGTSFIPSSTTMNSIINNNLSAGLILIDRIFDRVITGNITDSLSGDFLNAEVFVHNIDDTGTEVEPYMSSSDFGRYYRILLPGTYDLTFSAFGYIPKTIEDVQVVTGFQTELDVELIPAATVNVHINLKNENGFAIPNADIYVLDTPLDTVATNTMGYAQIDNVPYGSYEVEITAASYGTFTYVMDVSQFVNTYTFVMVEPFFIDDLELGAGKWNTTGDWGLSTTQSYSGLFSLADSPDGEYGNYVLSYATLDETIDLTSALSAHVEFMARYEIESGYDFAYFQISTNGTTWIDLESYTGNQTSWEVQSFDLLDYLGQTVFFRFKFDSDSYVTADGIYIDDFKIYKFENNYSNNDPAPQNTFALYQNYPNPFRHSTQFAFLLPANTENAEISIYNLLGQLVDRIELTTDDIFSRNIIWDAKDSSGNDVPSGVYFYKLSTKDNETIRKMVLMK